MSNQTEIAQKILSYLKKHPNAEDTLEGIVNWWLRSDRGEQAIDEVKDALNLLIEKGDVEEIKGKKDIVIYKVRKRLKV